MNNTELELLKIIADMEGTPSGAFNIRANGGLADRKVTENIDIRTKTDKPGIASNLYDDDEDSEIHVDEDISDDNAEDEIIIDEDK